MSLLPYLGDYFPFRTSRLLNQHFGLALEPEHTWGPVTNPGVIVKSPAGYLRNWIDESRDSGSTVSFDNDKFQADIDVQQFKPDEISVKTIGENTIAIEGKHEEKQDQHGYISRHFVRKYVLPPNCNINQVQSKLSSDGVLTVIAPKMDEDKTKQHREVPITITGATMKKIEQKSDEQMNEP